MPRFRIKGGIRASDLSVYAEVASLGGRNCKTITRGEKGKPQSRLVDFKTN